MADKKEEIKTTAKTVKKTVPKVDKKQSAPSKQEKRVQKEQQFFLKDLAERMGVSSFDYLLIKRENNMDDNTPVTVSEMKELYNKVIFRR